MKITKLLTRYAKLSFVAHIFSELNKVKIKKILTETKYCRSENVIETFIFHYLAKFTKISHKNKTEYTVLLQKYDLFQ